MRIQFLGAARTVTGSSHLVQIGDTRLLLDCGLYQGRRDRAHLFNHWLADDLKDVDAIVLSHGHLDHCGKLPVLTRAGIEKPIYCTEATADVARIVLTDSGEIQEEDAEYMNRRQRKPGEPLVQPLYTPGDVQRTMKLVKAVKYEQSFEIGPATITLHDAGHILGSSYVTIDWRDAGEKRSLLFTADIGRCSTPIIADPTPIDRAFDFVITESTYGGVQHGPVDEIEPQLLDAVKTVIARRGRLIVPSFAVGRTQTILWYMHKFIREHQIPALNVYVDSPMGVEVTEVTERNRDYFDAQTLKLAGKKDLFEARHIKLASSRQQSKEINADRGPCVIIASSPTCEFGRVLHHLKRSIEHPGDMILFVGFTPFDTLGRRIQDGQTRVRIYDRFYDVHAEVRTIHGLSAHADGDELASFLAPTCTGSSHAYVVHGEPDRQRVFGRALLKHGFGRVTIPALETEAF